MTPLDVERHLRNWSEWMRTGSGVRGYPDRVAGLMVGGNVASWEDLCDSCDKVAARATDASIADLIPPQQMAINHIHLGAYWRPLAVPLDTFYACALEELGDILTRKGMV